VVSMKLMLECCRLSLWRSCGGEDITFKSLHPALTQDNQRNTPLNVACSAGRRALDVIEDLVNKVPACAL
jgi:hypothetical protein